VNWPIKVIASHSSSWVCYMMRATEWTRTPARRSDGIASHRLKGFPEAAYNLGRLYQDGRGIPQSFERARQWYLIAAGRGETKAAVNLGVMNASGEGGRRDYRTAIGWFLFAAQRGDDRAKNNLGTMYFNGQGVSRDLVRAHMWYNLAAAQGDAEAIQNRASVAHLMTAKQIARAQKMASERQMYVP
jgi:TPR repeat protein